MLSLTQKEIFLTKKKYWIDAYIPVAVKAIIGLGPSDLPEDPLFIDCFINNDTTNIAIRTKKPFNVSYLTSRI